MSNPTVATVRPAPSVRVLFSPTEYEAIARQDSEAARAAMRLHLTNSRERLRQAHEEAEASKVGS